jgi:phosphoribosylformylglycinamidine synthase II
MQHREPQVTLQTALDLGLTEEEYDWIVALMGRTPNFTELSIFSVMWSEYYSHKNAVYWTKTLPREGSRLLIEAEEGNAGLVDLGDGLACTFKINTHDLHPDKESQRMAATIHGDILSRGARPAALFHSLRFGKLDHPGMRQLVRRVVTNISSYSSYFSVPVIGGEAYFYDCYNQNILVNTMSVGIVNVSKLESATAEAPGNPVFIAGGATGKDGLHKAIFAFANPAEESREDRPDLQAGDSFREKQLLEAFLKAIDLGAIIRMQYIGAAGIASSIPGMCARSGTGMRIDLDRVPTHQPGMRAFEILLSESREGMLIVGKRGMENQLFEIFQKQNLTCEQIGEVTDSGRLEFYQHHEKVVNIPVHPLVPGGAAPVYQREFKKPTYLEEVSRFDPSEIVLPKNYIHTARYLVASPNLASRRWIHEQFAPEISTDPAAHPIPSDAGIIQLKTYKKALAVTMEGNSTYVHADPYIGTMIAIAEAARNIVCSGGEPVALTYCLNFGNPHDSAAYWQFVQAIKGMGEACKRFGTPVVGGNAGFYNQSAFKEQNEPVYPTPTIGMLGIMEPFDNPMTFDFKKPGHQIYMIGTPSNDMASSEYLRLIHQVAHTPPPRFELDEEYLVQENIKMLINRKSIVSAHEISEGGMFLALLESAKVNNLGFNIESDNNFRKDAYLFGEGQSRVIISVPPDKEDDLVNYLNSNNVSFTRLGEVTDGEILVDGERYGSIIEWKTIHDNWLSDKMKS